MTLVTPSLQLKKQRCQGFVRYSIYLHSCSCFTVTFWSQIWGESPTPFLASTKKPSCRSCPPSTPTEHKSTRDWHFQIPFDVIFTCAKSNPLNSIFRISSPQPCLYPICCLEWNRLALGPQLGSFSRLVANKLLSTVWMDFNFSLCRGGGVPLVQKPHGSGLASLHW